MNTRSYILILFLSFWLLQSCSRKDDINYPVIRILAPSGNSEYIYGDTVYVDAQVTDDRKVATVSTGIVTHDFVPVISALSEFPNEAYFELNGALAIDNPQLKGGDYYLVVRASDGHNEKSEYQPIRLLSVSKELSGYILVENKATGLSRITRLNLQFEKDTSFDYPKECLFTAADAAKGNFYFISAYPSSVQAFELNSFKPYWDNNAPGPLNRFNCFTTGDTIYTGSATGDILGYNDIGQVVFKSESIPNAYPEIISVSDYLYSEFVSEDGLKRYLCTYYLPVSQLKSKIDIHVAVKGMVCENGKLLIFTHSAETDAVSEFDPAMDEITHLADFQFGNIHKVCKIDENNSLVATDDALYLFDRHYFHFSLFSNDYADDILYDPLNKYLYLLNDRDISVISYPGGNHLGTYSFDYPISTFSLVYNK